MESNKKLRVFLRLLSYIKIGKVYMSKTMSKKTMNTVLTIWFNFILYLCFKILILINTTDPCQRVRTLGL